MEGDRGRGRAIAELREAARDRRGNRRDVRNRRRAEAKDLDAAAPAFHLAEGDVVRRRHGLVFLGDPFAGRGDVADADFVEVAAEGLRVVDKSAKTKTVVESGHGIDATFFWVLVHTADITTERGVENSRDVTPCVLGKTVIVVEAAVS